MADEELPALPLEIPWRLASTTQPLASGDPDQTALSLFVFEPDDEQLTQAFGAERPVFLKFTASISPASLPVGTSQLAAALLGEGIPCFHVLLDLKVRRSGGGDGTVRPYFHAAAPLKRRMIQTGIVGFDGFEGESEGQFVGKSGSQMHESLKTHSNTLSVGASAGVSLGPISFGGSVRSTSTDVASDRSVAQVVDTTSRDASQERRELVSHTTRVENVLTLLNAKYVGTPHLSFSLAPQPLFALAVDPSDPNLWLQQLLARRSSGIEGIQEFTAVVVVPRDEDFCVDARLRRVCLLDSPPGPLSLAERFDGNLLQLARMVEYLYRTFPPGTPLEELDVDIISGLTPSARFRRPVVELWALRLGPALVEAIVASPSPDAGVDQRGSANYKHFLEVWLDTLRDEYEREASRSPLERGVLLGENRFLNTCFTRDPENGLAVGETSSSVSPLVRVDLRPATFDIGGTTAVAASARASVRSRAVETVARWNALEHRLATLLANRASLPEVPLAFDDRPVLGVLLDHLARLGPQDELNLGFEQAVALLGLDDKQRKHLASAGATDLAGIARALKAAPEMDRHNADVERLRGVFNTSRLATTPPDPVEFSLSADDGDAILRAVGERLAKGTASWTAER